MFPVFLTLLLGGLLAWIAKATLVPSRDKGLIQILLGAYALRMFIHLFIRDLSFFSHGGGGDYQNYETLAEEIVRIWSRTGVEFMTSNELPGLSETSLPSNLFALIMLLNGGDATSFGCTAPIAFCASLTCLNLYLLAMDFGADPRRARQIMTVLVFSPAFLLFTTDMFKDGLVLFFTTAALANAIRLSRRLSLFNAAVGVVCLAALWYVRFYLVFVTTAPLIVGLAGVRAKSIVRPLLMVLLMGAVGALVVASTDLVDQVGESANAAYNKGTAKEVLASNSTSGGSSITFDDGGNPWGALHLKLLYLIFAPFPWMGGSMGLQIGKVDTFLWYWFIWRTWRARKQLWQRHRLLVLMLGTFLVPTTLMYAATFANVGLSLRQRMVIVFVVSMTAMISYQSDEAPEPTGLRRPRRDPRFPLPPRILPASQRSGS